MEFSKIPLTEAKKLDIYQISEALIKLIIENDNDIMGVVESFLDQVEEDLSYKNSEYVKSFREAIIDYSKGC